MFSVPVSCELSPDEFVDVQVSFWVFVVALDEFVEGEVAHIELSQLLVVEGVLIDQIEEVLERLNSGEVFPCRGA